MPGAQSEAELWTGEGLRTQSFGICHAPPSTFISERTEELPLQALGLPSLSGVNLRKATLYMPGIFVSGFLHVPSSSQVPLSNAEINGDVTNLFVLTERILERCLPKCLCLQRLFSYIPYAEKYTGSRWRKLERFFHKLIGGVLITILVKHW